MLHKHIRELEELLLTKEVRTLPQALSLLIADDFLEYGSSGRMAQEGYDGQAGSGVVKMLLSGFELHPLSEEAVLAAYRTFNADNGRHALRSSIWSFSDGRLAAVFPSRDTCRELRHRVSCRKVRRELRQGWLSRTGQEDVRNSWLGWISVLQPAYVL
ncbi:DUF4440 domain-containing protein [Paenibacillus sp. S150]|uniref:DUF4440 domain-containing protein n=1 Tax=Paenibacillus sp. S150 TaxID=2749826 RepID=UPI001E3D3DD7|nr:DUF4440 domain-containing protein [Paenibacillus sp. S150]